MARSARRRSHPHLHRLHLCLEHVQPTDPSGVPDESDLVQSPYITFTAALVLLGLSAAFGGPWVERNGPRKTATAAALFFSSGLLLGGLGIYFRLSLLLFLGMGVIGGIGAGLGYIAPVSTLVKWFPDRRGMATGMAIMGFGGGAFVAGFLNVALIAAIGIAKTIMVLGALYFVVMMLGARLIRRPPDGYAPPGWQPTKTTDPMIAVTSMTRNQALKTKQFYLLWGSCSST